MRFDIESLDEGYILEINKKRHAVLTKEDLIKRVVDYLQPKEPKNETKENARSEQKLIELEKPCQACGTNAFIHTRHQGNRYGNFNIYRCDKCGMKQNVKDKIPESKEDNKEGMSERTKQLRDMALKMKEGQ
jgi:hypothetical protein